MRNTWLILLSLGLGACATNVPLMRTTASGNPEFTYQNTTLDKVSSVIAGSCAAVGAMIEQQTNNTIVCSKEMTGGQAVMAQLAMGNAYSTTPKQSVRYTLVQLNQDVRVWATMYTSTQMAFGQVNQVQMTSNAAKNSVQIQLEKLAAVLGSPKNEVDLEPIVSTSN